MKAIGEARVASFPALQWTRGATMRLTLSLVVVAVLLARVGPSRAIRALERIRPEYLAAAMALIVVAVVLSAIQWRLILRSQGVGVGLGTTTALYFVGLFFNNFLPSSIGGDVARIWSLSKETGKSSEAAASVVADRLFGAAGLGLTALVALAVGFSQGRTYALPVLAVAAGAFGLVAIARSPRWVAPLVRRSLGDGTRAAVKVEGVARTVRSSVAHRPTLLACVGLSVGFQLVVVAINVVILGGLGLKVPAISLLLVVPIISAVCALPISMNGLGVREAAYVYLLGGLGVDAPSAAVASLAFFVLVSLASLAGAVVLVARRGAAT